VLLICAVVDDAANITIPFEPKQATLLTIKLPSSIKDLKISVMKLYAKPLPIALSRFNRYK
jgi:hypothetical protein